MKANSVFLTEYWKVSDHHKIKQLQISSIWSLRKYLIFLTATYLQNGILVDGKVPLYAPKHFIHDLD